MSANGQTCWIKRNLVGSTGTQICGGRFKEEIFRITGCDITLWGAPDSLLPLTVYVWTNLDGNASDESFGIDNVIVSKPQDEGDVKLLIRAVFVTYAYTLM